MLFNKANKGAEELKEILGFINASNPFENMRTDITLAEDDMRLLIGNDLFEAIQEHYHSDNYNVADEEDPTFIIMNELVSRTQQPLAFYACRTYSAHGDLTHSDTGRRMNVAADQKPAWEWMINKDDEATLDKAHKLTDRLLDYLDAKRDNVKITELYTSQAVFVEIKSLFINNTREFQYLFPINNSRRFFLCLVPFIREIENTTILGIIGSDRFADLKTEIKTNAISDSGKELLSFVRVPLALMAMVTALKRLQMEVLPNGLFQNYTPGVQSASAKNPAPQEVRNAMIASLTIDANHALHSLQEFISKRKANFEGVPFTSQELTDTNKKENKFFRV